jgi:hypothetical protein
MVIFYYILINNPIIDSYKIIMILSGMLLDFNYNLNYTMYMKIFAQEKKLTCLRCGACCCMNLCAAGKKNDQGICIYLKLGSGKASCSLYVNGLVNPMKIGLDGEGCSIRRTPKLYSYYLKQRDEVLVKVFNRVQNRQLNK